MLERGDTKDHVFENLGGKMKFVGSQEMLEDGATTGQDFIEIDRQK